MNITNVIQNIYAINKKTKEKKIVNLLLVNEKRFNCPEDDWGVWCNYSKRGDWELFIDIYKGEK